MKKLPLYILVSVASIGSALAQKQGRDTLKLAFQDSVRIVLENTRNTDAMAVGAAFSTIWNGLGQDIQLMVLKQTRSMRKRGYRLRPHFQNYFGALVDAVNVENADNQKLLSYLLVAGQVIENEGTGKASNFFSNSREFFQHHALHYEKSFRLYARDDNYSFEYLKMEVPPPPLEADTAQSEFETWDESQPDETQWEEESVDSVVEQKPLWEQPIYLPELTGAVVRFDKVNLNFSTPYDSAFLSNTKGVWSLEDNLFVGDGGRFTWAAAGLSADSVFYDLKQYYFKTNVPRLSAEQGKLTYVGKVNGAIDGVFEFVSTKHKENASSYPRFMSYESNIPMLGLANDQLHYTGGFALKGNKILSSSVQGGNAHLEVMGEAGKKFEAQSKLFEFRDSTIISSNAAIRIYQDNDSIFHPAVQLRYQYRDQYLSLHRSKGNLKDAPFSSSFFRMDFTGDVLRWSLKGDSTGADSLNIFTSGGLSQDPMVIESQDFFDPRDFRLLKGVGFSFHPLVMVAQYATDNGTSELFTSDLVSYSGKKFNEVHGAMMFLAEKGMIEYEPQNGKIKVKDKAIHLNEARKNNVDYDNMKIHSVVDGPANATINFPKRYMTVRGVEEFKVSDSLNVIIKPDSSVITIQQNRDIKFNGKITAGNFEINGRDFMLKYDSFFINLNHIDSIRFYVTELNSRGQSVRRRINNSMVGADSAAVAAGGMEGSATKKTQGTLFINRPDNKSGKLRIPNFPRLDASAGGVIYFDRKEVLDGAYDRSVFFVVPPFKLDSLSDADPEAINFEGTFVSSGMFPSFKAKVHTMEDHSLGFLSQPIPAEGYPLYNGSGRAFGLISLNNAGIRVAGKIDYLAATVESEDFIYYPDSVVAAGSVGELKERLIGDIWYPQVTLPEYQLKWLPKRDQFSLKNLRDPFSLYNASAQLEGKLTVTKKGTLGEGKLITRGSESSSSEFSFSAKDFGARHAEFQVKTTNPDKPALAGKDVRLKFNLEQNYADISPEILGTAAIEFPYAQFRTSITDARWDLNTQKITMTKDADAPLEDSYFYTTRKELDSLVFNAEKAEYDIKTQQLKVSGIPFIVVADARITPNNNEVLILENAKIGQLTNTTIVIDTLNGYHRLTDGVVDIVSRKEFSGYATYQYINAVSDTFAIKMTDFHLEAVVNEEKQSRRQGRESIATQQTVANGVVEAKENLVIAPRIFYKGDMTMYATKPALQLKGFVKLDLKKLKNYNTWIQHQQGGDEKDIYLDFDKAITEEGSKVQAGLHFAEDNSLYITFVFDKRNPEDEDFFLPSGSLFFEKETGEFRIEDRQKAAGEKLSGKVFAYNEDKQEVKFEGPVNFFKGLKDFSLTASALGSGNLETNDIRLNSFIMADMNIPSGVYDLMAAKILEVIEAEGVPPEGLGDQTELLYKIADIIGEKAVKDYEMKSLQNYVSLGLIPELSKPIVFANTNLKWSQKHKAFYSEGSLGISNINKFDINGAFEGFMEIRKNEDGTPVFHVFFKVSPEAWYYFGYEDNRLMVHSADEAFNMLVGKKSNAAKAKVGELVFIPGSDEETVAFINRFREEYYGIQSPYDLAGVNSSAKKKEKKKEEEDDGF